MTFDRAAFGAAVRARRKALKIPQNAMPSGPSSTYVSQIEAGLMDPLSGETLDKLSESLGWNRVSIDSVVAGIAEITLLPIEPDDEVTVAGIRSTLQQAQLAQDRFERAIDEVIAAEAELDRQNAAAMRLLLMEQAEADYRPSAREIADAILENALHNPTEWTRYDMALIEILEPNYPMPEGGLATHSRYMDMTQARAAARRAVFTRADMDLASRGDETTPPTGQSATPG